MRREVLEDAMYRKLGYDPTHNSHTLSPARVLRDTRYVKYATMNQIFKTMEIKLAKISNNLAKRKRIFFIWKSVMYKSGSKQNHIDRRWPVHRPNTILAQALVCDTSEKTKSY